MSPVWYDAVNKDTSVMKLWCTIKLCVDPMADLAKGHSFAAVFLPAIVVVDRLAAI
jgi:hypothetical protein